MGEDPAVPSQQREVTESKRVPVPLLPPAEAAATFDEAYPGYAREQAVREARRGVGLDHAASTAACPFHVDIGAMVEAIARDDLDAAKAGILEADPWPGIMGRACHAFCERAAVMPAGVEGLALRELERAAATFGRARQPLLDAPPSGKSVAVIGAGSAGAAVTYGLRRKGHRVVVFDQLPAPGGMMLVGYPHWRMPIEVVREEAAFERWGAEMRLGVRVDRARFERIVGDHDAVVLTTGKFEPIPLDIPGRDLEGAYDAVGYLTRFRTGPPMQVPPRSIVIGAGFSALDVARTLKRLGSDVRIVYRRGQDELPVRPNARAGYVAICTREGIPIEFWTAITELCGSGKVETAVAVRTKPGPADASGRATPVLTETSWTTECDLAVAALGERVDVSFLPPGLSTLESGVWVDEDQMTSLPGVFASGEVVAGARGTEMAFANGLATAAAVDRYLRRSVR